MKVGIVGTGFLSSHLVADLVPHTDHFVLIDREKIGTENYENYILPRDYVGKRKVTAFMAMLQFFSPLIITPIHLNIKNVAQLEEHLDGPDIIIIGLDNVRSRIIAHDYAVKNNIPAIFMGVTEDYASAKWTEGMTLPQSEPEIKRIEDAMAAVGDVCTRIEFRGIGMWAAALAYRAFYEWKETGRKLSWTAALGDKVIVTSQIH